MHFKVVVKNFHVFNGDSLTRVVSVLWLRDGQAAYPFHYAISLPRK